MLRRFFEALLVLGLLALSGCARCASKVEYESFVSVPTELDAVEKLDDPPDVVVEVEKKAAPKGGGGGCGHSPICLVIIPFAIAEAFFPEKVRIARVSEKGRETYTGLFRENGQFVQALALRDGLWRKIALLQLPELGRNVVVEVQHAPPDAEGKPGKFERSSVQKQVDLLTGYRALLSAGGARRTSVLSEMLTHLQADALPVAKERLLDATESSEVKGQALAQICNVKAPIGSDEERRALLRELDSKGPDAQTSGAALDCFDPKAPEQARGFTARIIDAACAEKDSAKAQARAERIAAWSERSDAVRASVEPFVARCAASERRSFLRWVLGYPLAAGELRALAGSKDAVVSHAVISRLDHRNPDELAILLSELERPDSPLSSILLALMKNSRVPDAEEAKALAGAFILRPKAPGQRAELLARLATTPEDQQKAAKVRFEQKLAGESGDERTALHAALVMLGEREHEAGAALALVGACRELAEARALPAPSATPSASAGPGPSPLERAESECERKLPRDPWLVDSTQELAAFALAQAGCTKAELVELAASDSKQKRPVSGRVCKRETR